MNWIMKPVLNDFGLNKALKYPTHIILIPLCKLLTLRQHTNTDKRILDTFSDINLCICKVLILFQNLYSVGPSLVILLWILDIIGTTGQTTAKVRRCVGPVTDTLWNAGPPCTPSIMLLFTIIRSTITRKCVVLTISHSKRQRNFKTYASPHTDNA